MTSPNYRRSSVWRKARHLVLALSLAADSFASGGEDRRKRIQKQSIQLLLNIVEVCEAGTDLGGVESSLVNLEQILSESHQEGYLTKSALVHFSREIKELRSALREPSWRSKIVGGTSMRGKLFFSSPSGVVL